MPKDKVNGALFKNKKKEKKTHPDYTGLVTVDADFARELYNKCRDADSDKGEVRVNISAWLKEPTEKGKEKFMSLNFDFPRAKEGGGRGGDRERGRDRSSNFDDEIPFD